MKNKSIKITVIIIILVVAVVGYYAYLSGKEQDRKAEETFTVVQNTLSRSLELDYPPTPKEVIKYYNEILKCFYNEECTEEEIEALGNKARELYDAELLANNEQELYLMNLKADIQDYKTNNRRIANAAVASSASVFTFEQDGYEFARIMCGYTIMEGEESHPSNQVYLLRKDENQQWKIYGWEPQEVYDQRVQE